jgi:TRAP-type uncharacterized transport system substrate-binding protein
LLRIILVESGVAPDKVAIVKFSDKQIDDLARDRSIDATMVVGPLNSNTTTAAIAATIKEKGEPKFLAIEASEAIALKHPRYTSEEIP